MEVVRAELAAVIAGADAHARRASARAGRCAARPARIAARDRGLGQPVDDDFQHRADVGRRARFDAAVQGRAIGVVGGGASAPCTSSRPSSPERTMPPGNGMITSGTRGDRRDGGLGCRERASARSRPMIRRLPPPTASLVRPVVVLADELAVHHRDAPVAPAAERLRDLPAVAEIAHARRRA